MGGERESRARPIRLAYALVREWRKVALRIGVVSTVAAASEAGVLLLIGLVAAALVGSDPEGSAIPVATWRGSTSVGSLLLVAVCLVLVRTAAGYETHRLLAWATAKYEERARGNLLGAFLRAEARTQDRHRAGQLQDLALSDVEAGGTVVEAALHTLPALVNFTLLLTTAFFVSPMASLLIVLAAALLLLAMGPLGRRSRAATDRFTRSRAAWAQELSQGQMLRREIAVFGITSWVERASSRLLASARRDHEAAIRTTSIALVLYQSVTYLIAILLLYAILVMDASAEGFAVVVLLFVRGLSHSQGLQHYLHIIDQRHFVLERVETTIGALTSAEVSRGAERGLEWRDLRFDDVCFSYEPGHSAATAINFGMRRGEVVGLIGPSGAGKSTLALLALGLLRPDTGRVLVDGVPLPSVAHEEMAARCAYVPQEALLFEMSVHDNITLGRPDISDVEVVAAATTAGIHDEIDRLPDGYQTLAAERGSRFSVGQRQRIAIARALVGEPRLVVFDEPTSALDPAAEAAFHRALTDLRDTAMVLVISHRRDTAVRCDEVIYLRDGGVVAAGPGDEMWERAGFGDRERT